MIGNDVVDLLQSRIESNWQRKGFMDKLFTQKEQYTIALSHNSEQTVWALWSMKEAAYKIYNRQTGIRGYFPLLLHCEMESGTSGKVSCNGNLYFTKTTIEDELIHTIAVCHKTDFSLIFEPEDKDVLKDTTGLPYIQHIGIDYPASVSHHGKCLKNVALLKSSNF